jgi:HPt (histidine-containing phosphotransfer) domain-containing protein
MSSGADSSRPIRLVSQLLREDGDLRDIVEEFVAGLAARIEELRRAHAQLDFDALAVLAHRLKGAAGSYGYPDISRVCTEAETRFRSHEAEDFAAFLEQLKSLAGAAQAGLTEGS